MNHTGKHDKQKQSQALIWWDEIKLQEQLEEEKAIQTPFEAEPYFVDEAGNSLL